MGGLGSGRDSEKQLIEDCLTLNISRLAKTGVIKDGVSSFSGVKWKSGSSIGVYANAMNPNDAKLELDYTITRNSTGVKIPIKQTFPLEYTLPNLGGKRWWARCSLWKNGRLCNRRVLKLYLPDGGLYFGCRTCYGLVYQSSRESHQFDGFFRRIGADCGLSISQVRSALKNLSEPPFN